MTDLRTGCRWTTLRTAAMTADMLDGGAGNDTLYGGDPYDTTTRTCSAGAMVRTRLRRRRYITILELL
ncbi:hypothetical protein [Paenibacillus sp. FSL R5-0912]|uniref:hypothetical protein n=1 Tax=Paenibacillus sp. FSL R5-0912 TaxID=1536771 RepID=UPI0030EC16EC